MKRWGFQPPKKKKHRTVREEEKPTSRRRKTGRGSGLPELQETVGQVARQETEMQGLEAERCSYPSEARRKNKKKRKKGKTRKERKKRA